MAKLKLAENTQALKKLDTLIQKDDPYKDKPGGGAYVANTRRVSTITNMYKEEKQEKSKLLRNIILIGIMLIVFGALAAGMIAIAIM